MGTKKLSAIWRILTAKASLEGKMKLILFVQDFHDRLVKDLEDTARDAGELHTLQALRAITEDKLENK